MSKSKVRQVNKPGNGVGKLRQAIYASGMSRIREAIEKGYALEAIALCESMMADRLEARRAWKRNQAVEHRKFDSLGRLARALRTDSTEPEDARKIYDEVVAWADERNEALHQMFKLAEGPIRVWSDRYEEVECVATRGFALSRKVGFLLKKLNKF